MRWMDQSMAWASISVCDALDGPVDGVGFDLGVDLGAVLDSGLHQFPRKLGPGEKVGLFGEFEELVDGGVRVENGFKQDDECLFALLTSVHGCSSVSKKRPAETVWLFGRCL